MLSIILAFYKNLNFAWITVDSLIHRASDWDGDEDGQQGDAFAILSTFASSYEAVQFHHFIFMIFAQEFNFHSYDVCNI